MMWIAYAVKHNVKVLDLDLRYYNRAFLPHCIFTCPSLQELSLQMGRGSYYNRLGHVPATINLPSLRKLTLSNVELSQLSVDRIIAQSPVLEDLELIKCAAYFNFLDSKVLKRLTLDCLVDGLDKFTVVAPRLIHFQCIGTPPEHFSWREWLCVESAHIRSFEHTLDWQTGFTRIILHAKRLEVFSCPRMKIVLEKELLTCSIFENLEFLQIGNLSLTSIDNLYIILRFLQLSPRLQKLILKHRKFPEAGIGAGKDVLPSSEMTFQCPHLRTVIIECSKDDGGINTIVNAMVNDGVSLEKIQVTFYEDIEKRRMAEDTSKSQKQMEEFGIFEKMLKENPEWADDGTHDYDKEISSTEDDEDDDSESGDGDEDDDDDEIEDEDGDNDEVEDEDDDEMEVEDDVDKAEVGLGNNEHIDDRAGWDGKLNFRHPLPLRKCGLRAPSYSYK